MAGALWGALLDYYHNTGDPSYNKEVLQALLAPSNLGPDHAYMPPIHADEEGNDDLFFWGSAVLSAAERNFPQPDSSLPTWLEISDNVFRQLTGRWDTKKCGGGLYWQILASNPNGMTYKNSVSNGGLFQLSARLARATGNSTYLDWAEKTWDWLAETGIVDTKTYRVYDGASIDSECKSVNKKSFTYTSGIMMYGAAVLAEHTGDEKWAQRAEGLLDEAASYFFTSQDGSSGQKDIMYEVECEPKNNCNYDMITFKGYLSRFMWQTTQMMPSLRDKVESLLVPTAKAAAATCTGGNDGHQCGMKWYVGGFDKTATFGGQMCALETVQGLLIKEAAPPLKAGEIKHVTDANFKPIDTYKADPKSSSSSPPPSSKVKQTPTPSSTPTPQSLSSSQSSSQPQSSSEPSLGTTAIFKESESVASTSPATSATSTTDDTPTSREGAPTSTDMDSASSLEPVTSVGPSTSESSPSSGGDVEALSSMTTALSQAPTGSSTSPDGVTSSPVQQASGSTLKHKLTTVLAAAFVILAIQGIY